MTSDIPAGLTPVQPVRPVAPYLGGKRNLAKRLCELIDQTPCETYAEPFVGMGGIFLRRSVKPKAEVINDLNRDVATLFRILQRHYRAFRMTIEWQLTTRADFERLTCIDPDTLTDLERAARFLYLQRTAFGGKPSGRNFGVSVGSPGRFDLAKLGPMLEDVHARLSGVIIECLPYGRFIERYDRAGTLFYVDPPYWGGESDYGKGMFAREDFARLAEQLQGIQGRFVLSINDRPEIREMFAWADIQAVQTTYSVASGGNGIKAAELIISSP